VIAADDTSLLDCCNLLIQFRQVPQGNGVWVGGHGPGTFFLCNIQIPLTVGCQAWDGACLEDSWFICLQKTDNSVLFHAGQVAELCTHLGYNKIEGAFCGGSQTRDFGINIVVEFLILGKLFGQIPKHVESWSTESSII